MSDSLATLQYILTAELLGLVALPITIRLFNKFPDKGWGFSKIFGILFSAWLVWILSSLHILPFSRGNTLLIIALLAGVIWALFGSLKKLASLRTAVNFILIEEILFIGVVVVWTYLRGWSPDINGLEKFMDYGFMLSSMKTAYFPPLDHFFAGETINYYYFGHYLAAFITTIAKVPASFGYNLQMSLIFGLSGMEIFSLASAFFYLTVKNESKRIPWRSWLSGILAFLFVDVFGNLHTALYYPMEKDKYWYPDATRFIKNTIHEFPIYSYIVNDLHGHVSDIPIVVAILALLSVIFLRTEETHPLKKLEQHTKDLLNKVHLEKHTHKLLPSYLPLLLVLGFFIGTTYATNAWDFAIYTLLSGVVLWVVNALTSNFENFTNKLFDIHTLASTFLHSIALVIISILFYLPFWQHLVPISKGIGIVPLGGQSPLWQVVILWGVQVPLALAFLIWLYKMTMNKYPQFREYIVRMISKLLMIDISIKKVNKTKNKSDNFSIEHAHIFMIIISLLSFLLILLPEIIYMKDIYPTHYRANTMFKFYYQAWIMLGIVSGVSTVTIWNWLNKQGIKKGTGYKVMSILLIFAASMYPVEAIYQGFGGFKGVHQSINGTLYLKTRMPADAKAIDWINQNIKGQPTFIEAVGDSYTDYARIAANTGNPSVLGWPVHEWLWRGDYSEPVKPTSQKQLRTGEPDSVGKRVDDVRIFYETDDPKEAQKIITTYQVRYIYVGAKEREKYEHFNGKKFADMDLTLVYDKDNVQIYKVN